MDESSERVGVTDVAPRDGEIVLVTPADELEGEDVDFDPSPITSPQTPSLQGKICLSAVAASVTNRRPSRAAATPNIFTLPLPCISAPPIKR